MIRGELAIIENYLENIDQESIVDNNDDNECDGGNDDMKISKKNENNTKLNKRKDNAATTSSIQAAVEKKQRKYRFEKKVYPNGLYLLRSNGQLVHIYRILALLNGCRVGNSLSKDRLKRVTQSESSMLAEGSTKPIQVSKESFAIGTCGAFLFVEKNKIYNYYIGQISSLRTKTGNLPMLMQIPLQPITETVINCNWFNGPLHELQLSDIGSAPCTHQQLFCIVDLIPNPKKDGYYMLLESDIKRVKESFNALTESDEVMDAPIQEILKDNKAAKTAKDAKSQYYENSDLRKPYNENKRKIDHDDLNVPKSVINNNNNEQKNKKKQKKT